MENKLFLLVRCGFTLCKRAHYRLDGARSLAHERRWKEGQNTYREVAREVSPGGNIRCCFVAVVVRNGQYLGTRTCAGRVAAQVCLQSSQRCKRAELHSRCAGRVPTEVRRQNCRRGALAELLVRSAGRVTNQVRWQSSELHRGS